MARVLVIGAGMVGASLCRVLSASGHEAHATYRSRAPRLSIPLVPLDAANGKAVASLLSRIRPGIVVLGAGLANVDACEERPGEAARLNGELAGTVGRACRDAGARLVHLSTDYVFDGSKGNYVEEDEPNPVGEYGRSKLRGEQEVEGSGADATILRFSTPYGVTPERENFASFVVRQLSAGREVRAATDMISSPTYIPDLAAAIGTLLSSWRPGIHHVSGAEAVSRYKFALAACEAFKLDSRLVRGVRASQLGLRAPRPENSSLDSSRATRLLGIRMSDASTGLARMRDASSP